MSSEPLVAEKKLSHVLDATSERERRLVEASFLLLGAASSVTLSTVCLAASYFKDTLGNNVVSQFITAHTSVLLVVMLYILVGLPAKTSLNTTSNLLTAATLFGVLFNGLLLTCLLTGTAPSPYLLFPLVGVNGCAAGIIQSLSPRLGGDLPTTKSTAVGSLQLVGVSLAQWLPCVINGALLPLAAQPGQAHMTAGLAAKISLAAAGSLCLAAFVALRMLLNQNISTTIAETPQVAEAAITFLVVASPKLPVGIDSAFWRTYQVTLLLTSTNSFAFFGRSVGLKTSGESGITFRVFFWWALTPVAAGLTYAYSKGYIPGHTIALLLLYSLTAIGNGFALVLLNKTAQSSLTTTGDRTKVAAGTYTVDKKPCPIAAQLMWLSIQLGAFTMSFVSGFLL